jgi:hypothetical protein
MKIFGPNKEENTGGWRRLHNKKLHNFNGSPNISEIRSRKMRWAGHLVHMAEMTSA